MTPSPLRLPMVASVASPCPCPMGAADAVHPETVVRAADDFVQSQQALGASWGEAVGLAAEVYGVDAVSNMVHQAFERAPSTKTHLSVACMVVLNTIAKGSPSAANHFLHEGLVSGQIVAWLNTYRSTGLHLDRLSWVTSLPDGLRVEGHLGLSVCADLRAIPRGLAVEGTLMLPHCVSLESMASGLRVGGDVFLDGCASLESWEGDAILGGNLVLQDCAALRSLSANVHVGGALTLDGCASLEELSDGFVVGGSLYLWHCAALAKLPDGLAVGGDLSIQDCASLREFPSGLKVGGELALNGNPTLRVLPQGMDVGGSLDVRGCTSWDGRIPADAKIASNVLTDAHPDGIALAVWRQMHPDGERFF